jgi:16S rRNA pseudouridine516 synthase
MTLAEGKYHQVKRMVAAISNRVEALKRIKIGEVELPKDLAPGEWRWLTAAELHALTHTEKL